MPDPAILEAILLVVLLWVVVDRGPALLRSADLGIGLFRPWRGDPWPRGVQEDDDARFDWTPHSVTQGPALDVVIDVAADSDRTLMDSWTGPTPWIEEEEVAGPPVTLERLDRVEVHRAGH